MDPAGTGRREPDDLGRRLPVLDGRELPPQLLRPQRRGRSRGYGFVRFGDDNDKTHAMTEMNGVYCSTRPIRIGPATPRRSSGDSGSSPPKQSDGDSINRTVYVAGLDPDVSEDELRKAFAKYGDVASVKIHVGKQCGFVQFVNRAVAEEALQGLNGSTIGKQAVRLSWGRSPASKQSRGVMLATDGMACTMEHISMVDMATHCRSPTQTAMLQHMEPTLSTVTSRQQLVS